MRKNGLLLFKVVTIAIIAGFLFQSYSAGNSRTDDKTYIVSVNLLFTAQGTSSKPSENHSIKISFPGLTLGVLQIALLEINSILPNTFPLLTNRERNVFYVFTRINAP